MSKQDIIKAWKNPEFRKHNSLAHPSGESFHELSEEEMNTITGGSGDIQPQTTPGCVSFISGLTFSILKCNK